MVAAEVEIQLPGRGAAAQSHYYKYLKNLAKNVPAGEFDALADKLKVKGSSFGERTRAAPSPAPQNSAARQSCGAWKQMESTEEESHMRRGHHWPFEFGDAGDGTSCGKNFNLSRRTWEDYRGSITRFYGRDRALVIKSWLHRVQDDASGLTFQECLEGAGVRLFRVSHNTHV